MTAGILLYILIVHWVADFIFQSHEEATNKSTSFKWLCSHTIKYSLIWIFASCLGFGFLDNTLSTNEYLILSVLFGLVTLVAHTFTDFFTSKLAKEYFSVGNYHNGFVVVGFDQILHYIQLYLTFQLLL